MSQDQLGHRLNAGMEQNLWNIMESTADIPEVKKSPSPVKPVEHIKRPLNGFMIWAKQERPIMSKNDPSLHKTAISKQLGERWKHMSKEEKAPFKEESKRLMAEHRKTLTPVAPVEEHIKRPLNGFMIWAKQERQIMSKNDISLHSTVISKQLGERWKHMSDEEKAPFKEESKKLMAEHRKKYPDYHYNPSKRKVPRDDEIAYKRPALQPMPYPVQPSTWPSSSNQCLQNYHHQHEFTHMYGQMMNGHHMGSNKQQMVPPPTQTPMAHPSQFHHAIMRYHPNPYYPHVPQFSHQCMNGAENVCPYPNGPSPYENSTKWTVSSPLPAAANPYNFGNNYHQL